jgi:hypothetical protein
MGTVYKVLAEKTVTDAPAYFASRLVIEECENIHVHFRNMRLEFSRGEFIQFANAMAEAKTNLAPPPLEFLPLNAVDPWDEAHVPTEDEYGFYASPQDLHLIRIEEVEKAIKEGKRIRPILVTPIGDGKYKRKDGFCRYMGHKRAGKDTIECIVLQDAPAGGQEKKPFVVTPEEYQEIVDGITF